MSALFLYNFLFMSALFNQKNPLYYFCKKSNEHCPFISPKAHVFALHPQSGEGQKCAPPQRVIAERGRRQASFIAVGAQLCISSGCGGQAN